MIKQLFVIGLLIVVSILCGCLGGTEVDESLDKVIESNVVNLLSYEVSKRENRDRQVVEYTVEGVIENKLDRMINVSINAKFYDSNDNLIGEDIFKVNGLRSNSKSYNFRTTIFTVSFEGSSAKNIDYFRLHVDEY